jgi:hypothetical protein
MLEHQLPLLYPPTLPPVLSANTPIPSAKQRNYREQSSLMVEITQNLLQMANTEPITSPAIRNVMLVLTWERAMKPKLKEFDISLTEAGLLQVNISKELLSRVQPMVPPTQKSEQLIRLYMQDGIASCLTSLHIIALSG